MRKNDARRLGHKTLEELRVRAVPSRALQNAAMPQANSSAATRATSFEIAGIEPQKRARMRSCDCLRYGPPSVGNRTQAVKSTLALGRFSHSVEDCQGIVWQGRLRRQRYLRRWY